MKINNLGIDDLQSPKAGETVLIEVEGKEIFTPEEDLKDVQEKVQEIEGILSGLAIEDSEARKSAALEILEKERQLQLEREEEWKKEKKKKKIIRGFKLTVLIAICLVLLFALLGGYRIILPAEYVKHLEGIWQTAVKYFTGTIGFGS